MLTRRHALQSLGAGLAAAGLGASPLMAADGRLSVVATTGMIGDTARRIAAEWLARLRDLETVLDEANMDYLGSKLEVPTFDAVPKETLVDNREAVLEEIATAKAFFEARAN